MGSAESLSGITESEQSETFFNKEEVKNKGQFRKSKAENEMLMKPWKRNEENTCIQLRRRVRRRGPDPHCNKSCREAGHRVSSFAASAVKQNLFLAWIKKIPNRSTLASCREAVQPRINCRSGLFMVKVLQDFTAFLNIICIHVTLFVCWVASENEEVVIEANRISGGLRQGHHKWGRAINLSRKKTRIRSTNSLYSVNSNNSNNHKTIQRPPTTTTRAMSSSIMVNAAGFSSISLLRPTGKRID